MKHKTYIKMTGFVTKEPDLRSSRSGTPVCTIRLGVSDRYLDRTLGEWRDNEPSYYDVTCWRGLAENVTFSLRKGDIVTIHGTFRMKTWVDRNNNARHQLEITADAVAHEMAFGTSRYNRISRQQSAQEREGQGEANRQTLDPASTGGFPPPGFESPEFAPPGFESPEFSSPGFESPGFASGDAGEAGDTGETGEFAGTTAAGVNGFGDGDHPEDNPFHRDEFADTDLAVGGGDLAAGAGGTDGDMDQVGSPPPGGAPETGAPEATGEQRHEDAAVPV